MISQRSISLAQREIQRDIKILWRRDEEVFNLLGPHHPELIVSFFYKLIFKSILKVLLKENKKYRLLRLECSSFDEFYAAAKYSTNERWL